MREAPRAAEAARRRACGSGGRGGSAAQGCCLCGCAGARASGRAASAAAGGSRARGGCRGAAGGIPGRKDAGDGECLGRAHVLESRALAEDSLPRKTST